jgi:hypothetical protein
MKKVLLVLMAALLIMAIPALADNDLGGQSSSSKPKVDMFGMLGKGIASLPSDPTNFTIVKVGAGRVSVDVNGTETKVTIGILYLDDQRYLIRDLVIDNGSISGNLYQNDTQKGSLSVKSVMKGNMEVWVGTLTLDYTYNLYVLEAPRLIKKEELKDKVSEYCNETVDSNCTGKIADYCGNNPTDTRCLALFKAHCIKGNNMDDSRCRQFMTGWCQNNTEATDCRLFAIQRTEKYCEEHASTPVCNAIQNRLQNFCETDSNNTNCKGFCEKHSEKCQSVVRNLAEFCLENSNHTDCLQYCSEHPQACRKINASIISTCIQNPNAMECSGYCQEHPAACRLVTADLVSYCLNNQNETKCLNYCQNYPDACRKVTEKVEGFCSKNSGNVVCQAVCKRSPETCRLNTENEVEIEQNSGSIQNHGQNQNHNSNSGQGGH